MSLLDAYGWDQLCGQEESKKKKVNKKCKYCEKKNDDFIPINNIGNNEIEIEINRKGILRVRHYGYSMSEDIINVNFCPICGRKFTEENNNG